MNVRFKIWTLALLPFCLSACGDSVSPGNDEPTALTAISFAPAVEAHTRGGDATTGNLTSMGVFAYFTQGGGFSSSSTPNFMYDQEVKKVSSSWTYSPTKYWPGSNDDKLSFFAYAPYNATTPSGAATTGYPSLTYTVPTTETTQTDLLAAVPLMNKTREASGASLSFTMKHALTKVKFVIKNGDSDGTTKIINSFSLKAQSGGTLTYTSSTFTWASSGRTTTFTPTNSGIALPTTQNATQDLATFYLIPDKAGLTFSMKYTMQGTIESGGTTIPAHTVTITDKSIDADAVWTAGKAIKYTITIKKTGLEVAATGDTWEEDKREEIQIYTADELKPGDYYYSDGTISDGGVRALNLKTGECVLENPLPDPLTSTKTAVGIVFYVGLHSTDNCTYTTKGGSPMGNVKGYVVSLDNVGTSYSGGGWLKFSGGDGGWYQVGTSTATNDYEGYANTHLIRSTAQAAGVWKNPPFHLPYMVLEGSSVTVSDECSGWYMPSAGQVVDLYKYRGFIQKIMEKLSKQMVGSIESNGTTVGGVYWTSTEADANNAYKFNRFNGNSGGLESYSKQGRDATRPILTF